MRTNAKARTRRMPAAAGGLALVASLTAISPHPAEAATESRPTFKTVRTIPHAGQGDEFGRGDGGRGTVKLNSAVSQACNAGQRIVAPQWYFIGEKTRGSLRVAAAATYPDRRLSSFPSGTAIVDHWTGEVLTCSTENFPRTKRPVDVVAYLAEPVVDAEPYVTPEPQLDILIGRVSAPPPSNDLVADAEPITALPFHDELDTSGADDDGPSLEEWACDFGGTTSEQARTVWYSYRPTETGPAPAIAVAATTNWQGANRMRRSNTLRANILEVLPDGATRKMSDPFDCEEVPTLEGGANYLIGVYFGWDSYYEHALTTGGPISVSVTAR